MRLSIGLQSAADLPGHFCMFISQNSSNFSRFRGSLSRNSACFRPFYLSINRSQFLALFYTKICLTLYKKILYERIHLTVTRLKHGISAQKPVPTRLTNPFLVGPEGSNAISTFNIPMTLTLCFSCLFVGGKVGV